MSNSFTITKVKKLNKVTDKNISREKRTLINTYLEMLQDFLATETTQQRFIDEALIWASSNQSDRVLQKTFSDYRDRVLNGFIPYEDKVKYMQKQHTKRYAAAYANHKDNRSFKKDKQK